MPQIVHWNPRLRLASKGVLWRVPRVARENNFGDLLGPWLVARMCDVLGLGRAVSQEHRLLTIGSIINTAGRRGDIVWGSGIHGNHLPLVRPLPHLDVRAVRGPLSAEVLRSSGIKVPQVYGDPALLIPHLWSDRELGIRRKHGGTVIVPNFYDMPGAPPNSVNPRGDLLERVRAIASASRVIASSLHGIIIAEAFDVPAVLVASKSERTFKYDDYYQGTGRGLPATAPDWDSALKAPPADPIPAWKPEPLIRAFPSELWSSS